MNLFYEIATRDVNPKWQVPELPSQLMSVLLDTTPDKGVTPKSLDLFRALQYFSPEDTKCIVLGTEPYTEAGKANGLAFGISDRYLGESSNSIREFANELKNCGCLTDTNIELFDSSLESWAEHGILLLNIRLSSQVGGPASMHAGLGWEQITESLLRQVPKTVPVLALGREPCRLADSIWGENAWNVIQFPRAGSVAGSKCFSKINTVNWGGYKYNA